MLFTAHSVPVRTIEAGDNYERQTRETAELVAAAVPEIAGQLALRLPEPGHERRRVAGADRGERD